MSESLTANGPAQTPVRLFPWFCPHCRRKEVRRATIPYECQRLYQGKPMTVVISELAIPKCSNCGELVFDYVAEEQINQAYQAQSSALGNGQNEINSPAQPGEQKITQDLSEKS